ncbi:MAG TPA: Ig-like domain repeat protein, partial [Actinotalea sp.]
MSLALRRSAALLVAALLGTSLFTVVDPTPAYAVPPAAAPVLVAPVSPYEGPGNPVLSWQPVAGATKYRVEVSASGTFSPTVYTIDTYALHATPPTELPLGTLYWRVAGLNGSELGPYATESFVKTAAAAPDAVAPADGASLSYPADAPVLRWGVLAGMKGYEVQLDDANDFIGATTVTTVNTALAITAPVTLGKTWYWRVRGTTATTGVTTAWSTTRSFSLTWGDFAGKPVLLSEGVQAPVGEVQDVVFTWTGSGLPGGMAAGVLGARSYQLQVSANGDWANGVVTDVTVKGTQFSPASTYPAGSYFWRVRAIATGPTLPAQTGPWSDERQFTRAWSSKPSLTYPIGGAEVSKTGLRFEWTGVAHAAYYEVRISTDQNFVAAVTTCYTLHRSLTPHDANALPAGTIGTDCDVEFNPGLTYYWQVRGVDTPPTGSTPVFGVWANRESFVFDQSTVTLISPVAGETVTAPVLRWAPLAGYHKYLVTLIKDGTKTTTGTTYSTSWSPTTTTANLGAGSYEWFVQGVSPGGIKTPSPFFGRGTFTVAAPTSTATQFAPGDLTTSFGGQNQDMPSMRWTEIQNAAYYRVFYAQIGSSTYVELTRAGDKLPQAAFTYPGGNTALPLNHQETLPDGTWSWVVQAFSVDNALLAMSDPAIFTLAPSQFVSYVAPALGATGSDVPEMRWNPAVDGYEYIVHIALDPNFTNVIRTYTTQFPALSPREALPDNQAGQSYYWYVQVCKAPHSCGPLPQQAYEAGAQNISSFRKTSPAPVLTAPAGGATVTGQVAFAWQDYFLTDSGAPGAKSYKIEVATDPTFTTIIDTATVDQPYYAPWSKAYADTVYYWRVQAIDGSGQALTRSDNGQGALSFQKVSGQPASLTSTVASGLPTLSWAPLTQAGSYTVDLYRGTDGTYPLANRVQTASTTYYAAYTPDKALAPGTYSWRVAKNDVDGNPGSWAGDGGGSAFSGDTFTIGSPALNLVAPADAATLTSSDTLFTWDGLVGAASYRFQTSTTDAFTSTFESQKTVGTTWVSPKYYVDGTTYRWRVQALDSSDNVISTSAFRTFTKNEVTVALTSSANPSKSRQSLVLSAAVSRAGATPTGAVTFFDGATSLGSGTLASGVATLTTTALGVGTHQLTARWAGDSSSAATTSTILTQDVVPAGAAYTPVTPSRVMSFVPVGTAGTYTLTIPNAPVGATAVALHVTAANPTLNTYVSVCPGGTATDVCSAASNINPFQYRSTPNMVIVKL